MFGTTTTTSNPGGARNRDGLGDLRLVRDLSQPRRARAIRDAASKARPTRILIEGLQRIEAIAEADGRDRDRGRLHRLAGVASSRSAAARRVNDFDVSGTARNRRRAPMPTATDGPAIAQALISQAIAIEAIGGTAATVDFDNDGLISIAAVANAISGGQRGGQRAVRGRRRLASPARPIVTGDGTALADLYNAGTIEVSRRRRCAMPREGAALVSGVAILGARRGRVAAAATPSPRSRMTARS